MQDEMTASDILHMQLVQLCLNLKGPHIGQMSTLTVHHRIHLTPKTFCPHPEANNMFSICQPSNPGHGNRWARVKAESERAIQEFYRVPKTSHRSTGEAERLHLFNITACRVQCLVWKPHTCWCPRLRQTQAVSCQSKSVQQQCRFLCFCRIKPFSDKPNFMYALTASNAHTLHLVRVNQKLMS